jgi:hypothetical protein
VPRFVGSLDGRREVGGCHSADAAGGGASLASTHSRARGMGSMFSTVRPPAPPPALPARALPLPRARRPTTRCCSRSSRR